MTSSAQNHARFILRCVHPFGAPRRNKHSHRILGCQPFFSVGPQRDHYEIVLGLAQHRSLRRRYPHNFVLSLPRPDGLSDRIHAWEKLVSHIGPNHANPGSMILVHLREKPSVGNINVSYRSKIRSSADNGYILAQNVPVADVGRGVLLSCHLIG